MTAISKTVYVGRDNPIDLEFSTVGVDGTTSLRNFTGAYSFTIGFVGISPTVTITDADYTTLTAGQVVDITPGSGVVRFRLGQIPALIAGTYRLRVAYKTAIADANQTQLVHEYSKDPVVLRVVGV